MGDELLTLQGLGIHQVNHNHIISWWGSPRKQTNKNQEVILIFEKECFNLSKHVVAGTNEQSIILWRLTDKTRPKVLGKVKNCTNQKLIDTWHCNAC